MPLPSLRKVHRPVYREVLTQAFRTAWHERRYWPLALFASLLLTAGSYDVLYRSFSSIQAQSEAFVVSKTGASVWAVLQSSFDGRIDIFAVMTSLQLLLAISTIILSVIIFSCVSQAGLVYAIGGARRGNGPTLREAIRVGGGAFWPVAALNALVLTTLWILRFLIAFPLYLALEQQTTGAWFIYFLAFLLFMWLSFMVTVIHIFALNSLILQGTPIAESILRAYVLFKKNWIVVVETALLLFLVAAAIGAASVIISFIAMIPLFAAMIAAAATHSPGIFYGVIGFGFALVILGILALAAFVTQLQYATWTHLYRRLGEGGVIPKIHRWIRSVFGLTSVPQR